MEYLSNHPLLLSVPFHDSVESISAVRILCSFFLREVNERVKELALAFGIRRPIHNYKDLLYEYARIRFTSFLIPELKEQWLINAVKEDKVEKLRQCSSDYNADQLMGYAASIEMVDFLKTSPSYSRVYSPCPTHSLEVSLRRCGKFDITAMSNAMEEYILKDNVEEIETLTRAFGIRPLDVPNLYTIIGPHLFQVMKGSLRLPGNARTLRVRCHHVAIHFIENGTLPDLKLWVRAGIYNVDLMKYLFEKGVDIEYVRLLFEDIVSVNNCELLKATMKYLGIESLEGRDYLLEYNISREYIQLLHALGGHVCKNSILSVVEECCRDENDDTEFLEEMLTFYGIEIVHAINREWFHYEVIPRMVDSNNMHILAFCMQHRNDYSQQELRECYSDGDGDEELELCSDEYDLSELSVYQREKLNFYLAQ